MAPQGRSLKQWHLWSHTVSESRESDIGELGVSGSGRPSSVKNGLGWRFCFQDHLHGLRLWFLAAWAVPSIAYSPGVTDLRERQCLSRKPRSFCNFRGATLDWSHSLILGPWGKKLQQVVGVTGGHLETATGVPASHCTSLSPGFVYKAVTITSTA